MTAFILIAILQAPAAQDPSIEDRIEAFLKGDEASRTVLLKLGAYAIRPLQKAREKDPKKIDALVYELKKAAAHPKGSSAAGALDAKITFRMKDAEFPGMMNSLLEATGLPLFFDQLEGPGVKPATVNLELENGPKRELLDQICRQTGLDYGFFHNMIVVSRPDRLWPAGPPPKAAELRGDDLARARKLVEKLGDDAIEARESATRDLLKFGPSVIPVLEANLGRKEAEIVTRCSSMIEKLRVIPRGAFGPSGAERQKKTPDEEKALKQIQVMKMSLSFDKSTLEDMVSFLKEFSGIPIELQGDAGKQVYSIQARDQAMFDLLSLITQSRDLDFAIKDGKVVIDTREAIEKILSEKK